MHAKEYLPSEEYEGTRAFSEPETRITHSLAAALEPLCVVSVHSGIKGDDTAFAVCAPLPAWLRHMPFPVSPLAAWLRHCLCRVCLRCLRG